MRWVEVMFRSSNPVSTELAATDGQSTYADTTLINNRDTSGFYIPLDQRQNSQKQTDLLTRLLRGSSQQNNRRPGLSPQRKESPKVSIGRDYEPVLCRGALKISSSGARCIW